MPGPKLKTGDPCENCRERHLKCDDNEPSCRQCERLKEDCIRTKNRLKIRSGLDVTFEKDQPWLKQPRSTRIQFVDQTPDLENHYAQDNPSETVDFAEFEHGKNKSQEPTLTLSPAKSSSNDFHDLSSVGHGFFKSPASSLVDTVPSRPSHKRRKTNENSDVSYLFPDKSKDFGKYELLQSPPFLYGTFADGTLIADEPSPSASTPANQTRAVEAEYKRLADSAAAAIPSASSGLLTPEIWKKSFFWPNDWTTTQCACLMRHYVECIAPWFDVCDSSRHFALVVPQRARRCPPLLNAIFTASARHLSRVSRYKTPAGVIQYHGISLYDLTAETAIKYHNACIAYLIELSKDAEHIGDENLLAAAVILRYYEELDTSFTGSDSETSLRTFQIFVNAQASAAFSPATASPSSATSPLATNGPPNTDTTSNSTPIYIQVQSFQRASFRVAIRQEITAAFMAQRPIRLPFQASSYLRCLGEADDAVWTDRLIVFCADVLHFCFSPDEPQSSSKSRLARYNELKAFETAWDTHKPLSFTPIHYREPSSVPNATKPSPFPQIWHLSPHHASAIQYLELARILLIMYNPSVVSSVSPINSIRSALAIATQVRHIVSRLCGIALSNRTSEAALLMALMGIAMCGEYVTDSEQRRGMLELLEELEKEHARGTGGVRGTLEAAWGGS